MNGITNYLLFPSCQTEESINRCRFALLKMLALYNLRPPATISVVVFTNLPALFEIFQAFFQKLELVEKVPAREWTDLQGLQQLLSGYEGNALVCGTNGYFKKPAEELFAEIGSGVFVYCLEPGTSINEKSGESIFKNLFAAGLSSAVLRQSAPALLATAHDGAAYFTRYKPRKEVDILLKTFFQRNEEESLTNLVKKARNIDIEAIEAEVTATDKLPFYKRWLLQLRGKNTSLRKHLNKL